MAYKYPMYLYNYCKIVCCSLPGMEATSHLFIFRSIASAVGLSSHLLLLQLKASISVCEKSSLRKAKALSTSWIVWILFFLTDHPVEEH